MPAPLRLVCKVLCPDVACGSFIGEKGGAVREMEQSTNTLINVSKKGEYYPGYGQRVIAISGFNVDSIFSVLTKVIDVAERYSDRSHSKCVLVTSDDAAGSLLGSGGRRVLEITRRFERLNVNLQNRNEMGVIKERYLEITSLPGILDDVKKCAKLLINILCERNVVQPVFDLKYPKSNEGKNVNRKSDAEFSHMEKTWEEIMEPIRKHTSKQSNGQTNGSGVFKRLPAASEVDCSVFKDEQVLNSVDGKSWEVAANYTVYLISKNSRSEPVFTRVN